VLLRQEGEGKGGVYGQKEDMSTRGEGQGQKSGTLGWCGGGGKAGGRNGQGGQVRVCEGEGVGGGGGGHYHDGRGERGVAPARGARGRQAG